MKSFLPHVEFHVEINGIDMITMIQSVMIGRGEGITLFLWIRLDNIIYRNRFFMIPFDRIHEKMIDDVRRFRNNGRKPSGTRIQKLRELGKAFSNSNMEKQAVKKYIIKG